MEQSGWHIGGTLTLDHRSLGADRGGLRQKGVPIKALTHQRNKQLAGG
jgi:hypothetical protein